ncbi:MAG: TIGR00730 family Rossman fold protein [Candidatus Paceibacterota bacterium]
MSDTNQEPNATKNTIEPGVDTTLGETATDQEKLSFTSLLFENIAPDEQHRLSLILDEFIRGFRFLQQQKKRSVSFFGSARTDETAPDYLSAQELATRIVTELDYSIVTGGGPGIMEAANRGACDADGTSLGLTIQLPKEQSTNPYVKESVDFHYFFVRKVLLAFSAEAYVFFPGGFGTMDELFELITLIQTKKIKQVPIFLVDHGYWENLDKFIRENLLERKTISPEDMNIVTITDDMDQIIETIKNNPLERGSEIDA